MKDSQKAEVRAGGVIYVNVDGVQCEIQKSEKKEKGTTQHFPGGSKHDREMLPQAHSLTGGKCIWPRIS